MVRALAHDGLRELSGVRIVIVLGWDGTDGWALTLRLLRVQC